MLKICKNSLPSLIVCILFVIIIASCNSTYTQKPRGFFKIDFPEHQYQVFDKAGFPYKFEYPVYANIVQDSAFFDEQPENPYWLNIEFPQFHSKIYISYIEIGGKSRFKRRDAKGNYIDSTGINTF